MERDQFRNLMVSLVRTPLPTNPKITVLKRRKPMGSHQNIDFDKFPKQGEKFPGVGARVRVCFHYDSSRELKGTCVRDDTEEPGEMLIQLDDGRIVRAVECMWTPAAGDEPPHGWVCYNGGPGAIFWSPVRGNLVHELTEDLRPATAYEKALFERFGTKTSQGYMVEPDEALRQRNSDPASAHAAEDTDADGRDDGQSTSDGSDGGGD